MMGSPASRGRRGRRVRRHRVHRPPRAVAPVAGRRRPRRARPVRRADLAAAVTERIRLIPNIVVLPYRNPFVVAKAAATLDVLSGGRFTLAVATGYLRSEYRALGVDFDERNALFEEAIEVSGASGPPTTSPTRAGISRPRRHREPQARPPPPIWIGGNSALARRRVAAHGDGWRPFPAPGALADHRHGAPRGTRRPRRRSSTTSGATSTRRGGTRRDRRRVHDRRAGPGEPGSTPVPTRGLDRMAAIGVTWSRWASPATGSRTRSRQWSATGPR